ncbi:lipopolysaccharide biosynthesis protein [Sphingomonas morindae]|uniref:Lipopolysaccharide biosynthesis protein n=1 Tax=Sphingomonas morindae TaxID=1541170 RepID=A0ABY4X9N3_9SPHN|nr:lipopolysaccharide biosynthesis protein [Sphingomonas morindae]USI73400.1 lipopolysaccharide biosynthesis protein [Sphingomonas morindae]
MALGDKAGTGAGGDGREAAGGLGRAVARNLGWLLASRGLIALLSLVYLAIATRSLGVAGFGRFALIVGAASALTALVQWQTWQILVQYGARHQQSGDETALGALLRCCWLLDCGSALVGLAASAAILGLWHGALGVDAGLRGPVLAFTAAELLSLRSTALGLMRLRDRFRLAAYADSVTPVLRLAGAIAAGLFHPSVTAFLAAWGFAELCTAATYWLLFARIGGVALLRRPGPGFRGVLAQHPGLLRFAVSTNLISSLELSTKQVPLLLTGGMVGVASAGVFRLASQLAQALSKVSQLISRAAFPEIVRTVAARGLGEVGALFRRAFLISALLGALVFLLIVLIGRPVLGFMGPGFVQGYPLLLWLAAAGCVDLATAGFEPVLFAAHRSGLAVSARVVAALGLCVAGVLLAPRHGALGVAIGVLVNALLLAAVLGTAILRLIPRGAAR